jgi:membrane fusion protein (multidrug efflux system)
MTVKPAIYTFASLAIITCTLLACTEKKKEAELKSGGKPNILNAEGYVVKPMPFQTNYIASGSLLPNEEIKILSEISGRVTNISFTEGGHVSKGQTLVTLYNRDIKAQIEKLNTQRELQVKIGARQGELVRVGGISLQEYETTTSQIKTIDADIAYTQAQLRKTTVLAPFSGRIGIRNISIGAVITPSTEIATLQQTEILKMDFTVPDQYHDEVVKGKKVYFTVTGTQDTFTATVGATEPAADPVTRTLKIRALADNKNQKLIPGSFTRVIIPFNNKQGAILVPPQSVIPTTREKVVAVVKNGKAAMVPVKLGQRTNDVVEILQGLNPGDTILTTGIMQVKPGMTVKVRIPAAGAIR